MDLERFSCSIGSTSAAASSSAEVFTEMDAAEALADLAQLAMRETVAVSAANAGVWGSKGKRVSKRVKSESPPSDLVLNSVDSNRLDLLEKRLDLGEDEVKVDNNVLMNPVKVELDAQSPKSSSMDTTRNVAILGGRSRQNLTEAEKEARKIRRILANRESARQTIHRRQALCRELTKKAADLTLENEDLKKKKELAFKEYQSLETINKQLKAQMAKAARVEAEETTRELKRTHVESTSCPLVLYNQPPFLPVCWPSIIQSSNPGQSQYGPPQNTFVLPPNIPLQATGCPEFSEKQENTSGPKTPLYMVPYAWFYPISDHGNSLHAQPSFGHVPDETSMSNQSIASSSLQTLARAQNHEFFFPIKNKASALPEARPTTDLNEPLFDSPSDKSDQNIVTHLTLAPRAFLAPVKPENGPESSDYTSNTETIPTKASHNNLSSYSKKDLGLVDCSSKKLTDTVAAAEARKSRKELTKLKNLYGHQCSMQC